MNWADQVLLEMSNEDPARGVAAVADQQKYHNEMKAEIDAREDTFANVVDSGRAMIKNGHFAADAVSNLVSVFFLKFCQLSSLTRKFVLHFSQTFLLLS